MTSDGHAGCKPEQLIARILGCSVVLLLLLSLLGGILTVGDHLARVNPILGACFYVVLAIVVVLGIAYPLVQIARRPIFSLHQLETGSQHEQRRHRRLLADNLLASGSLSAQQAHELQAMVEAGDSKGIAGLFISVCGPTVNDTIKSSAKRAFFTSVIARGALVEALTMVSISLDLVRSIVQNCGFRPTRPALGRLYLRVMLSAVVAGSVEDLDLNDMFSQAIGTGAGAKASGLLLGSTADGLVGAFLVFRIGVITRDMLFSEQAPAPREQVRRASFQSALDLMKSTGFIGEMLAWVKSGATDMAKSAGSAVQETVQNGFSRLVSSARKIAGGGQG